VANYPEHLVGRPADEAARLVALAQLDAARAARRRLTNTDDAEALHDFRVALRRLRSTIRSFGPQLDARVPRKWRRRLRDIARATNGARDTEVQIAWIRARRNDLPAGRRAGVAWLLAGLAARRDQVYAEIRQDAAREFDQLDARLRRALSSGTGPRTGSPRPVPPAPVFGSVVGELIREHAAEVARELGLVRSADDEAEAHAARIQAKRLRYLLEPLADEVSAVPSLVDRLKQLQNVLGELHDVHVLIGELGDAVAGAAAERARQLHDRALRGGSSERARGPRRPQPSSTGLLALARLAADWQNKLYERVAAEWLADKLAVLLKDTEALADALVTPLPPSPPPAERRVPRRALPRRAAVRH
jgi:CHAD domain-containing protein